MQLEQAYAVYREPYSSLPLLAALLVQCIDVLYSYLVLPRSTLHFINIAAPLVPIAMLVAISIAESFSGMLPKFFVDVSKRFNDITFVRELAAIIIALTIGLSNVIDMVSMRFDSCMLLLKSLLIFMPSTHCKCLLIGYIAVCANVCFG